MKSRIAKSKTDKVIDGVCGGLAEYFEIDPVIVRLVFVMLIFIDGLGLLLYLILMIIMPKAENIDQSAKETIQENVQDLSDRVKEAGAGLGEAFSENMERKHSHRGRWLGIILILFGIFFLLDNLHLLQWIDKALLWPIVIILIGAWLLIKRWS